MLNTVNIIHLLLPLFLLTFFVGSCTFGEKEKNVFIKEEIREASLLLSADSSDIIRGPSVIKAVEDGFLLYDYSKKKIFKLNYEGGKVFSFGKTGRGPGEFQDVFGMWELDDHFQIFDYTSAKLIVYSSEGTAAKDIPLSFEQFPERPVRVELLQSSDQFIYPSFGRNGSLLTFVDLETKNVEYFGNAVDDYVQLVDFEKANQAILSGQIPAHVQNSVLLRSNQTGIFSFESTTGILKKYSFSKELIWEKHLDVPALEGLFDQIFKKNIERIKNGLPTTHSFAYGKGIDTNDEGVAILLNVLEDQPVTVAWVPNSGEKITVVSFEGIENHLHQSFALAKDGSWIFFVDILNGEIYKAKWLL